VKAMDIATAEIAHLRERAASMEGEVTSMIITELVG
jgi:vacuolar (H+)-ATPase G subunit